MFLATEARNTQKKKEIYFCETFCVFCVSVAGFMSIQEQLFESWINKRTIILQLVYCTIAFNPRSPISTGISSPESN